MNAEEQEPVKSKRSGCLTAFLILMLIVNPLTGLYYLFAGSTLKQSLPTLPGWFIPVMAVLSILIFATAIGIWKWKRWGVYGFVVTSMAIFAVNTIVIGVFNSSFGLIGVVILLFLIRPVWQQMD